MVYRSIEHNVQLDGGQGLVGVKQRKYGPGEFSRLFNLDYVPGDGFRSRRAIRRAARVSEGGSGWQRIKGRGIFTGTFVGTNGKLYAAWFGRGSLAGEGQQGYVGNTTMGLHWDPDSVAGGVPDTIHKFHQYNNKFYYIGGGEGDGDLSSQAIYYVNESTPTAAPTKVDLGLTGPHNHSFIFRDRLWVFTDTYIRWSKATDPTAVQPSAGGGFVKLADEEIQYAFPHREQIYVLTTKSIYILSYASNPGTDGSLSILTQEMGGHYGTVFEGVPYIANPNGVYSLLNGYPEKICDLDVEEFPVTLTYKLVGFDDTLYIIKQNFFSPANIVTFEGATVYAYNVYSGTLAKLDYREYSNEAAVADQGFIVDAINVQLCEGVNEEIILWMVYCPNKHTSTVYYTTSNRNKGRNLDAYDDEQLTDTESATTSVTIKHELEIPTVVPDGNEWVYKKFRHMFVEGTLPSHASNTTTVSLGFVEGTSYTKEVSVSHTTGAFAQRQPWALKFGINQRGRSLAIKIVNPSVQSTQTGLFSINRIVLLWTYLNKAMHKRNSVSSDTP